MSDAGPRVSEQTTDTYRLSAGVKGYLDNEVTWDSRNKEFLSLMR